MIKSALRTGSALTALSLATLFAVPAYAQTTAPTTNPGQPTSPTTSTTGDTTNQGDIVEQSGPQGTPTQQANQPATGQVAAGQEIVITGSILRNPFGTTPSPVTTVTTESLDRRGISTVQEGIQNIAANNGPALTNSFTANGAFAAGASAVSLRGLSTNSTLVLFDGLRAAYYPLADDGSRNFVDLNTIPDDIVERIDVLRDGASASYGADAIAGVVNIITKKTYNGIGGRVEAGISSRGDAEQYRASLTAGIGDLARNGVNAYISGFYYKSKILYNRDRPYPYNSDDERNVCGPDGTCGSDLRVGAFDENGLYVGGAQTASNFLVRPYTATNATIAGSRYQVLNPSCGPGGFATTLSAAELAQINPATGTPYNAVAPLTVCTTDWTNAYGVINPDIKRLGLSGRVTANVTDEAQAYVELNFMQSEVSYTGFPATVRGTANTGIFYPQFSTSTAAGAVAPGSGILTLPIYVCPQLLTAGAQATMTNGIVSFPGCTAANGVLNPNNPFAAQGQVARLIGRDLDQVTSNDTRTRAYRGAAGVTWNITDKINLDVGATAMHVDLRRRTDGYVYIQNFLNAVAAGTYNFANPAATPQSVLDYITPVNETPASSDQYQLQAILGADTFELPGGALQVGIGGSIRYEAVDAPSGNSDFGGPTQRYFTLNAFGTKGSRWIHSAFAEVRAPVLDILEIDLAGRYDHYSSGQSAFSPKAGVIFKPIRQVTLRGTWSKGFRIPSFGEANALPTTGFVSNTAASFNNTYLAQYGCTVATFSACPAYISSGSYGQTTLASPDLDPEKSRSITVGGMFEPIRNVTLTVDYYNIKKTGAITQPSNAPALLAYYTGQPIPAGYTVIADAPDPNFPNATPRIAFVQSQLVNANTIKVSGLDFGANARFNFGGIRWTSQLDASYILKLSTTFPDGTVERYDGTLGNFNLTAGSGTPKWHGTWENSLDFGRASVTGTLNYFGGYDLSAMDQSTGYKDCGLNPGYSPTGCHVPRYITFDLGGRYKVTDNITVYANVLNLFDKLPPIDVVTYGAHLYNPVQGGTGILGRYFKAGVRFNFAPPARVEEPYVAPPAPPPPPEAPATQTCADGSVILATAACPAPPPPPPPPAPAPERG